MGLVLHVTQDVSLYRYSWGSSQATPDPLISPPRLPLHPVQGSPVNLQKLPLGCHCGIVVRVTVTLGLPFVSVELTSPWAPLALLRDVSKSIKSVPLSHTKVRWNEPLTQKHNTKFTQKLWKFLGIFCPLNYFYKHINYVKNIETFSYVNFRYSNFKSDHITNMF